MLPDIIRARKIDIKTPAIPITAIRLPIMVAAEYKKLCGVIAVSYTHLRAHETPEHLVCRLLLEKKKKQKNKKNKHKK